MRREEGTYEINVVVATFEVVSYAETDRGAKSVPGCLGDGK